MMVEIAGAAAVCLTMVGLYAFILRGTRLFGREKNTKGPFFRLFDSLAEPRSGREFTSGLLAVLCLASLTAETGASMSAAAGAGLAIVVLVCRVVPRTLAVVKIPLHFMYSVLGILGALAAARDYLLPADTGHSGNLLLRWVLLALVWSFITLGTFVGFTTGNVDWKVGLLLFGATELVVYMTLPLESQLGNPGILVGVLLAAVFLGVVSTMVRFRDAVELAAALTMTLGSFALLSAEQGVTTGEGIVDMTGPVLTMLLTFIVVYAVLRAGYGRFQKTPIIGKRS